MNDEKELSPHTVSILAAVAQAKERTIQHRLIELLNDKVATDIAHEIVAPCTRSSAEVKEAADGIRRWAENQRQPRKLKPYAYGS